MEIGQIDVLSAVTRTKKKRWVTYKDTVKLLLSDQLRDHQKAVAKEKGSPNATKVHHN